MPSLVWRNAAVRCRARDSFSMNPSTPGEVEVLPPERPGIRPGAGANTGAGHPLQKQALSYLVSYLMDNLLKVPGTQKARVGINPFLDLVPGIGDAAATIIQAVTILEAHRRNVPRIVLARMALNVLLNGFMGMIPAAGEVFAFWFKPTTRNYDLLLKHAPQAGSSVAPVRRNTTGDWLFVGCLLAGVLVVMGIFIALGMYILAALWHALFSPR